MTIIQEEKQAQKVFAQISNYTITPIHNFLLTLKRE